VRANLTSFVKVAAERRIQYSKRTRWATGGTCCVSRA
jgi:hypothetical protein